MDGRREALIVVSYEFEDPSLRRLRAPGRDADALARVLKDPLIGDFGVHTMLNEPEHVIGESVEEFFSDRAPGDLLLFYFSGHGIKDEDGELYLAASNTKTQRLGATGVAASFVNRCVTRSRSRRVVLLLDCCYAGAFERGMVARVGTDAHVEEHLGGRGRAVITATSAMQYAFEGDRLADGSDPGPSVFTSALVEGLDTGDADRDQDGRVGLDELYDYVYERVRDVTPNQTPGKWTFGIEGELYVAHRRGPVKPSPLPPELLEAIGHPLPGIRVAAVHELELLVRSDHAGLALAARLTLEGLTKDDSSRVAAAAATALEALTTRDVPVSGVGAASEEMVATPARTAGMPVLAPPSRLGLLLISTLRLPSGGPERSLSMLAIALGLASSLLSLFLAMNAHFGIDLGFPTSDAVVSLICYILGTAGLVMALAVLPRPGVAGLGLLAAGTVMLGMISLATLTGAPGELNLLQRLLTNSTPEGSRMMDLATVVPIFFFLAGLSSSAVWLRVTLRSVGTTRAR
jgi:Caspase domain